MERDIAYSYVVYGMRATEFSPKAGRRILWIDLIFTFMAFLLYQNPIFISICIVYMIAHIIMRIVFKVKWNCRVGFVAQGSQLLLLGVAVYLFDFSLGKAYGTFGLPYYLVSAFIQICAIPLGAIFAKYSLKKHKKGDMAMNSAKQATEWAIIGCILGMALFDTFFTPQTANVFLAIIGIGLDALVCVALFFAPMAFHRAYLIKKYALVF